MISIGGIDFLTSYRRELNSSTDDGLVKNVDEILDNLFYLRNEGDANMISGAQHTENVVEGENNRVEEFCEYSTAYIAPRKTMNPWNFKNEFYFCYCSTFSKKKAFCDQSNLLSFVKYQTTLYIVCVVRNLTVNLSFH